MEQPTLRLAIATRDTDQRPWLAAALDCAGIAWMGAPFTNLAAQSGAAGSFIGRALARARAAAQAAGLPAIAEAGGFAVAALGGAPGGWAAPTDDHRPALERLAARLARADRRDDLAAFTTALAVAWPWGRIIVREASTWGRLVWPPRGEGADWDPVFVPDGATRTLAELGSFASDGTRRAYAHRGRLFETVIAALA